jgi:hypothetical protein
MLGRNNFFDLIQNTAIGTIALHSFTIGFHKVSIHKESSTPFPKIEYLFYVLPIVYNEESLEIFKSSHELYSALLKDRSVVLGLQDRANKMSSKTFDSLNLAFSKRLLTINKQHGTIELEYKKKLPLFLAMNTSDNTVKKIQDCSQKLGAIFAKKNEKSIEFELNIKL